MTDIEMRIGQYEVILLRDGSFETSTDNLTHPDAAGLKRAIAEWGKPKLQMDVNCFALRSAAGVTLIDAGTGAAWGPGFGHARAAMGRVGISPDEVSRVILTHIHGDHALGLFDGKSPYFPHADVFVPQADFAFFTDTEALAATAEARRGGFSVAAQLRPVYGERIHLILPGSVLPGVEAIALPGHTPGHTGYLLQGEGDGLLIWADALHLATLQPGDPDVGLVFDLDVAQAAATRKAMLGEAAAEGWIVAGSHVTGFHRVGSVGNGFELIAV